MQRCVVLYILQVITVSNAMIAGWEVKKIDEKTFEFCKSMNSVDIDNFDLEIFMHSIMTPNLHTLNNIKVAS